MIILTIRTDKEEAEIGLFNDNERLSYMIWQAHRELAETIHEKIKQILDEQSIQLKKLEGIVVFKGPGSFTGLRIGLSVANALAFSLNVPIVASENPNWLEAGISMLKGGQNDGVAIPEYGALPNITTPKH